MSPFEHILVGVDFSDAGQAALRTAVQLARYTPHAHLNVVHFTESESRHTIKRADGAPLSLRQALLEAIAGWDPSHLLSGRCDVRVVLGDAPEQMVELANGPCHLLIAR